MKSPVFHPRAKRLKSILAKRAGSGDHAVPTAAAERRAEPPISEAESPLSGLPELI